MNIEPKSSQQKLVDAMFAYFGDMTSEVAEDSQTLRIGSHLMTLGDEVMGNYFTLSFIDLWNSEYPEEEEVTSHEVHWALKIFDTSMTQRMQEQHQAWLDSNSTRAKLQEQLNELAQAHLAPDIKKVDPAELPDRVGELVGKWVSRALASVTPDDRAAAAITLPQAVINALTHAEPDSDTSICFLTDPVSRLLAVNHLSATNTPIPLRQPLTPLRDTVLMTNARDQPAVGREIEAEIESADSIDLVLAFIRWTGIRQLLPSLKRHAEVGR